MSVYIIESYNDAGKRIYLRQNKDNSFSYSHKFEDALRIDNKKKAKNIINSSMPKILKRNYNWSLKELNSVAELKNQIKEDVLYEMNSNESSCISESIIDDMVDKSASSLERCRVENYINNNDLNNIEDIINSVNDLQSKLIKLKCNKDNLSNEVSNVDAKISDILHYIEFNRYSASEGFKLCEILKQLRLYRRKIKRSVRHNRYFQRTYL